LNPFSPCEQDVLVLNPESSELEAWHILDPPHSFAPIWVHE
jgi:hypothetical protein